MRSTDFGESRSRSAAERRGREKFGEAERNLLSGSAGRGALPSKQDATQTKISDGRRAAWTRRPSVAAYVLGCYFFGLSSVESGLRARSPSGRCWSYWPPACWMAKWLRELEAAGASSGS